MSKNKDDDSNDYKQDKEDELKLDESPCELIDEDTKYPDFISAIFSNIAGKEGNEDYLADNKQMQFVNKMFNTFYGVYNEKTLNKS